MTNREAVPVIDPTSPVPVYHQLKELLLTEILSGRIGPGERLPTEHELCARYGVSRTPVGRALGELAAEGVVVRHRRRGTFVDPTWSPTPDEQAHLTLLVPESSRVPVPSGAADEAVVEVVAVPPDEVEEQLHRFAVDGNAPDLALVDLGRLAELVAAGIVRSIGPRTAAGPAVPALGPPGGGRDYAVPLATSASGLWVRTGVLRRAGMAPPQTWEELRTLLRFARDFEPRVASPLVMAGSGREAGDALLTVLASNRPPWAGPLVVDDASSVAALGFLRSAVDEGLLSTDVLGSTAEDAAGLFADGAAVALIGASTEFAPSRPPGESPAAYELRLGAFPGGPGGSPLALVSGWGLVVTRQSASPGLALRTAAALAAAEGAGAAVSLGMLPVGAAASEDAALRELVTATGRPRPWEAGLAVVAAELSRLLAAVLSGRHRPPAAAGAAQEVLEAVAASGRAGQPGW